MSCIFFAKPAQDIKGFWACFLYLFIYLAVPGLSCSIWVQVPRPEIESQPPALGMGSSSLWTTREVPDIKGFFFLVYIKPTLGVLSRQVAALQGSFHLGCVIFITQFSRYL